MKRKLDLRVFVLGRVIMALPMVGLVFSALAQSAASSKSLSPGGIWTFTGSPPGDVISKALDQSKGFTVSALFGAQNHGKKMVLAHCQGASGNAWELCVNEKGQAEMDFSRLNSSSLQLLGGAVCDGVIHQMVGVYDAAADRANLYLDGKAHPSTLALGNWKMDKVASLAAGPAAIKNVPIPCVADQVLIYNGAMSRDELEQVQGQTASLIGKGVEAYPVGKMWSTPWVYASPAKKVPLGTMLGGSATNAFFNVKMPAISSQGKNITVFVAPQGANATSVKP